MLNWIKGIFKKTRFTKKDILNGLEKISVVDSINYAIDVPILTEAQERVIIQAIYNTLIGKLEDK